MTNHKDQVRVVDISPSRWLQNHYGLLSTSNQRALSQHYGELIDSYITDGNESVIEPQMESHAFHTKLGCNTLRTFTDYLPSSVLQQEYPQQRLDCILRSSVYSAYYKMDKIAKTPQGMFGGVDPVQIAGSIGPLWTDNDRQRSYEQILEVLAPSVDIMWIQNIESLGELQVIMEIAKDHLFDEQIWITINSEWMLDGGGELFDFFMRSHNPGSIVVVGSDWKEINWNLVMVQSYTEIEGGTKFGVIVDNKDIRRDNRKMTVSESMDLIADHLKEVDQKWEEVVHDEGSTEWTDDLLERASKFWIEEGVSIIGCEWESGLRAVQKQAKSWNDSIGKRR